MHATATWRQGYEVLLEDDHGHHLTVDLSPEEGGRSAGPSGAELLLLSLAGSLAISFVQTAHRRGLAFEGVSLTLESDKPSRSTTIERVHGVLRIRTRASASDAEAVLRTALRACPVASLFEKALVPLDVVCVVLVPHVRG